jgi:hypothetical protein
VNYIKNNKIDKNIIELSSIKKQVFKLIKQASRHCGAGSKRQDLIVYSDTDDREFIHIDDSSDNNTDNNNNNNNNNNKRQKLEIEAKLCYYCQSSPNITICNEDVTNIINTPQLFYQINSNLLLFTNDNNNDNNSDKEPVLTDLESKDSIQRGNISNFIPIYNNIFRKYQNHQQYKNIIYFLFIRNIEFWE